MRPSPLDRKVLRDLWRMKLQALAIALLIACGVSVAVMSFSAQRALAQAQARYYAETRFADVFAQAKRAPLSLARELAQIDGVTAVDVRISAAGLMHVPGLTRPATARLISLPTAEEHALNRLRLTEGRLPDPGRTDEVVALKTFLEAAHLKLGDRLNAVIGGRAYAFTVVGAALSPEYVYVPAPESFMPDDAHQGVFWAPRAAVERAGGMTGAFNTVAATVAPGASTGAVLRDLDRILAPYGGRAAYARADQPSNNFLEAELKELSTSASVLPPIFLIIAASLVHLVVTRLVEAEREQIGLLKAFGYGDAEAAAPYVKLAMAIGLVGALAGGLAGAALGASIVEQYRRYFRFPVLNVTFHWEAFAGAAAVAIAAALIGSLLAVRRAAGLSPAVAMQPPRPAVYREGLLDRLTKGGHVDQATRMIVRHLERFPGRAALSTVGLAASLSLLVGTQFMFDSLDKVVEQAYYRTQSWSEQVGFEEAKAIAGVAEVARLPGVLAADPTRVVAARLKGGGREELTRIIGLPADPRFQHPLDGADRPVPFKGDGIILSEALASRLGARQGDRIWVEVIDGRGPKSLVTVTGLTRDYSGFATYMERRALNRLMGEGDVANGAQLLVAADQRPAFYRAIEAIPQIVGASSRDETVAAWRLAMAEAFRVTISFYVGFAGAIAFGVAYNTLRISFSERARDLATLHVLGFGHGECAYILAGELAILAILAAPLGVLGGQALAHGLGAAYSRDEVRLPAVITLQSYGVAFSTYFAAVLLGGVLVTRRIWGLDLVAVLKTRE
ncbi:ABC transporter permease [Phenylobacterium soli]|uniref:ABC transporter permease n=1 Tax=Phenylobacterium soli TaxID=2170551 RepID=A0A328ASM2_9CAUL|nr:FtsX-like permease family protein [Phenylobacterium soli]RAK55918.1 ABC transporter permease [Phenylobacterium soli]